MLIADHLGGERKDALLSDAASLAKHQTLVEDSNTVLDMTISLCGMAAKKAQEIKSGTPFSKQGKGTGRAALDAFSYASPIAPFLLSGTLLRLFLLSCPSQHLGRAVDLLNACELVLSVHQRLEGTAHLTSTSTSTSALGRATGTSSAATAATQVSGTPHHLGIGASSIKTSLRTGVTTSQLSH
jgi:hypothetical protein